MLNPWVIGSSAPGFSRQLKLSLYVKSTNANDGTMSIRVTFQTGTNIDTDNVLVQNRVSQGTPGLPVDVKNDGVKVVKSLALPMMVLSVYSPDGIYGSQFLGNYATINLNDALARIPGVGQVSNFGAADYAMRIWVKPDRLARLGLTVSDLKAAIQKQSTVNPAGKLGGEPAVPGQQFTYSVRAQGRLVTAEDFAGVIVRENPDGSVVRLSDVSRIELGAQNYNQRGRFNGKPAALVLIYQAPGSNALAVAKGVKATMAKLQKKFPVGLAYEVSLDTTLPVTEGIDEILHTLFEAVLLVLLVVFLFLQSWRATLIPLVTVPVSLIGAFALFPLFGFSINTLSLLGLVLAIGLVVDDAIVVVEAVEHHIEHGLDPMAATQQAMKEVSGPVVAVALVLAAVFVPVAFIQGITGRLYQQFALTIAISVMISAMNALTLSPALCALLLKPKSASKGLLARFFSGFNRAFGWATGGYVSITRSLARKLVIALALLLVFTFLAGRFGSKISTGFVPEEDQGYLFVNVSLPPAASLERTDEVCKKIEQILAHTEGIKGFDTIAGYSLLTNTSGSYYGFFFVQLEEWKDRIPHGRTDQVITREVNAELAKMPEAQAIVFGPPAIPGIGTGGGFSFMVQDQAGGDVASLAENTNKVIEALRKRPEIGGAFTLFNPDVPQAFIKVDREKLLKQGVEPNELYGTLQAFMGGAYINDFNRFGRQWKVYLSAESDYRSDATDIENFFVRSREGKMVPLSSLTQTLPSGGPDYTTRFNLFRSIEVSGRPAPGYSSGDALRAIEEVSAQVLPSDYGIAFNNLSYQEKNSPSSAPTFAFALVFVFLILAAQYESWSTPFAVLLVVPVGVAGAFAALLVSKMEFNVFGQVGLIMLIGLAAKNAILIVEFAKVEYENGKELIEATLEGARLRLRPIIMTAFAFILGCIPLLTAKGAGAAARNTLGTVVVFGTLTATLIGIFMTPALYVFVEKMVILTGGGKKKTVEATAAPRPH
jgi:HAE1 family hydrophobic/amphiphilic exporter-1